MPEECQIQTVMVKTGCDRETAIKDLEWSKNRVAVAIRRVVLNMHTGDLICPSCMEPVAEKFNFCPYCG